MSKSGKRQNATRPVDLDPHGETIAGWGSTFGATKYLKLLQSNSSESLETHILSFELNMRKQKTLLAFQIPWLIEAAAAEMLYVLEPGKKRKQLKLLKIQQMILLKGILKLSPDSPDAKIFREAGGDASTTTNTNTNTSTPSSSSAATNNSSGSKMIPANIAARLLSFVGSVLLSVHVKLLV
ncbi:hypothetical protein J5N97_000654 [Dioscorea zingiberensis]|uniref:Uncharacterized protein n=1 Tax=Dioscorea zingiberensis TaxID=325984 RepID=A0A9D5H1D9_9LILI|nr:hypothetical protein J5N97_000654 [Dioscorea zingiberensis]